MLKNIRLKDEDKAINSEHNINNRVVNIDDLINKQKHNKDEHNKSKTTLMPWNCDMIPAGYYYTNDEQFIVHIKEIWSDNIIDLTGDDDISITTISVNTWNAFGLINNQQPESIAVDDDDDDNDTTSSTSYATETNTLEKSSSDESTDIINSDDDSSCTDDD